MNKTVELVYGIHPVKSILNSRPQQVLCVYVIQKYKDLRIKSLVNQIKQYNINIQECTNNKLNCKVQGALHQGVIAKIIRKPCMQESDLPNFLMKCKDPLLVVLDGVTDPHNLGACLRSADAAGAHAVIAPSRRSASLNSTVRKVSSGSVDNIPFVSVTNLVRTLRLLKKYNIWVIGTVVKSNSFIFDSKLNRPLAFVIGSEGRGVRRLTKENCDELITIPMLGVVTSLNVSVATGICLFEALRQRRKYAGK